MMLVLSMAPPVESAPVETGPDFSAGFERLITLGLPPLEGAEWLVAADENQSSDGYELRELLEQLKGGGWKVQQEGKSVFIPLGGTESTPMPNSAGQKSGGGLFGILLGGGSKKPKTTDVLADANKLIDTLSDAEKSKEFRERLEYRGSTSLGRLLLFATQLQQAGHLAEANGLASAVFSLGITPQSIIDAAINSIAQRDQNKITTAFFATHDWVAYERDLRMLVERYPRGWADLPAVQMLLPAVGKRAAKTPPPMPANIGITPHPEAIAALEDALNSPANAPDDAAVEKFAKQRGIQVAAITPLMRKTILTMLSQNGGEETSGPWLIQNPPEAGAEDPWSRLKRLGTDALPALAAVVADDTLTESPNDSGGDSDYSRDDESDVDNALQAYKSMKRPLSRGELASRLLIATVPGEDLSEAGPAVLAEATLLFWKAHHGQPKLNLLLTFLGEGNDSQKFSALASLAEMPDPAATKAFEQHILENEDAAASLDAVTLHLKARKSAAKDFFVKFSIALKDQLDGADLDNLRGSGGYEIKSAGGVNKYLKKLSLFVGEESPRKLILGLAKAEKPDKKQIASLAETVAASSEKEFVPIFLEAAVSATSLETRSALVSAIYRQASQRLRSDDGAQEKKDIPVPPGEIAFWTKLLADERVCPDLGKVQSMVAAVIEIIHSPGSSEHLREIHWVDPKAGTELVNLRAKDRLAGKAPTPLPDAEKVSPARMEELLKQLGSTQADAIHGLVQGLPLDEKIAFKNWRHAEENSGEIPQNLIAARSLIVAPRIDPAVSADPKMLDSLELKPGTKIEADRLISLAARLAPQAKERSGLSIILTSSDLDTGYTPDARLAFENPTDTSGNLISYYVKMTSSLMGGAAPDTSEDGSSSGDKPDSEGIAVILWSTGYDQPQHAAWTVKGGTVTPPPEKELEKFRKAFSLLENPAKAAPTFTIVVLHRDDLEKASELMSEDDEYPEAEDESSEEE